MARHGIVAILAAAAFGVGVNAGPCKPYSSVALSSTTIETAASTITTGVTGTTDVLGSTVTETSQATTTDSTEVLDTTVTETATGSTEATISIEPTITTEVATTLATTTAEATTTGVTSAEATTTEVTSAEVTSAEATTAEATTAEATTAEATTTSVEAPPACDPTQILVNPSFDEDNDASPWVLGTGVTVSQINPRSQPNFLYNTMTSSRTSTTFFQTLPPLGNLPYQLDYYFNLQTAINGRGFSCSVVPSVNGQALSPSQVVTDSGPYGFRLSSQRFTGDGSTGFGILSITVSCTGTYNTVIVGVDDFSLQRVCDT
ncbi:hypothetical protein DER45DRAFT_590967 [Fusarium avenaceum]|nr:hypothetical protein DER45DRAFT_590967 [Fusarium avenaceum]